MPHNIQHLHHVTATVAEAQDDLDFYTGTLGLRLVKQTVNFDNPGVYHFYYGNEHGMPGTIMTTFPYHGQGVRVGKKGAGQVTVTSFSVPADALHAWRGHLADHGVTVREGGERFGEIVLTFDDPSGLILEVIGTEQDDRAPWTGSGLDAETAIRGFHSVTLTLDQVKPTAKLLTDVLGFEKIDESEHRTRYGVHGGGAGRVLDLVKDPEAPRAVNGLGTVHHVALAIGSDDEQLALRADLLEAGYRVTEVRDRKYFHSIYFRTPGGVLFEVATIPPGFTVDEDVAGLGRSLRLPDGEEPHRAAIEAALPNVRLPA